VTPPPGPRRRQCPPAPQPPINPGPGTCPPEPAPATWTSMPPCTAPPLRAPTPALRPASYCGQAARRSPGAASIGTRLTGIASTGIPLIGTALTGILSIGTVTNGDSRSQSRKDPGMLSLAHKGRQILLLISILLAAPALSWVPAAEAALASCRADPIIYLSDGTTLNEVVDISTDVSN